MDEIIKKGIALAEKEAQEKQIQQIKNIVQNYLEKIDEKIRSKNKLDEEIRLLKKDLDDLKKGRIDLIKERQEKDSKAKEISPIIIKIVERIEYSPFQPWKQPYDITWRNEPTLYNSSDSVILSGQSFSTFTGGAYNLTSGNVINL